MLLTERLSFSGLVPRKRLSHEAIVNHSCAAARPRQLRRSAAFVLKLKAKTETYDELSGGHQKRQRAAARCSAALRAHWRSWESMEAGA